MEYVDYEYYEPTDEFSQKINDLVSEEVKSRMKETVEELESLREKYSLSHRELCSLSRQLNSLKLAHEKELKEAVKAAQREYWFDCAVGDKVFVLKCSFKTKACERCGNKNKVKVIVDSVEVDAECPVCGTYAKRRAREYHEFSIVEGRVERLQIEMTATHKWIKVWVNDTEYNLEYNKVFRTKEECQAAYDEATKGG